MARVSVIIPNYNHARFLTARLESIFSQTYQDFEVIILDDGSSDDSRQVIAPYLADARVRFYPNDVNSGSPFIQWNRGVELARGELIWIAESDDIAEPQLLSALIEPLIANREIGISYCQSRLINGAGEELGSALAWTDGLDRTRWRNGFVHNGIQECSQFLLWKNTIPNASAVVFRRSTFVEVGGAPLNLSYCGDWFTWVKMLMKSSIAFQAAALNSFRWHQSSVRTNTSTIDYFRQRCTVQNFILSHAPVQPALKRELANQTMEALADLPKLSGEFAGCLRDALPILSRCPTHTARLVISRIRHGSQRHLFN